MNLKTSGGQPAADQGEAIVNATSRFITCVALTLCSTLGSCAKDEPTARRKLDRSTTVGGIPCAAGDAWVFEDGSLRRCTLAASASVSGLELPAGSQVDLEPSGRLEFCRLGSDAVVKGAGLPSGTRFKLDPDGTIRFAFLPDPSPPIQGHRCRGTAGDDWMTTFHPGGNLKLCWLAEDEEIQGVPCARATFWGGVTGAGRTNFHPDGSLESCTVSREVTLGGESFRRGDRVQLDPAGKASRSLRGQP